MNNLLIFTVRIILGLVLGVILTRIFRPDWNMFCGAGMGILLVGVAYLMELMRKKKQKTVGGFEKVEPDNFRNCRTY